MRHDVAVAVGRAILVLALLWGLAFTVAFFSWVASGGSTFMRGAALLGIAP